MTPRPAACARSTKRPQIVRRPVEPRRRVEVDAVVAPAEAAGEIGDGHHLDDRDAEIGERVELGRRSLPRAGRRERADVELVEDLALRSDAAPLRVRPLERRSVHDGRRTVRSIRLIAGYRVGPQPVSVESIPVARARHGAGNAPAKEPVGLPIERMDRAAVDREIHATARGRPHADRGGSVRLHFDAGREAASRNGERHVTL